MSIPVVDELGREIELAWRRVDFEPAAFPQVCAERLETARLHAKLAPDDIVRLVFDGDLPQQSDPQARIGEPPVTVFRARRFSIDALFWIDGTTSIHDHAFSGAFQMLSGQSIETSFAFSTMRDVDGQLRFGELAVAGSALRRAGEVRAIPAGPSYIHSSFHLDRPSVSLVIRSCGGPGGAAFEYSPAGIAYAPFIDDPIRDRMLQIVGMLRRTENPTFERVVGDLVGDADLSTAFSILRACVSLSDPALLDRLVDRVRDPEAATRIRNWIARQNRIDLLVHNRTSVQEPAFRFLLAALLNVQRRSDALALVAAYAPGPDPARQLAAWLRELARATARPQATNGASVEPSGLGLPAFGPGCEEATADLLSGRQSAWTADARVFLYRLRALPSLQPLFV